MSSMHYQVSLHIAAISHQLTLSQRKSIPLPPFWFVEKEICFTFVISFTLEYLLWRWMFFQLFSSSILSTTTSPHRFFPFWHLILNRLMHWWRLRSNLTIFLNCTKSFQLSSKCCVNWAIHLNSLHISS